LVLALAAVLVPELAGPTAASATPSPTASLTVTASITPTATATATLTFTPTATATATATLTFTPEVPDETAPAVSEEAAPEQGGEPEYDCTHPPPDNAQALGWRERCEDAPAPNTVAPGLGDNPPGQGGSLPGNSGNAPGRSK
ncbi:MAG: hypothetical protein JXN59_08630, partial [Anaerolineae bacterium]|nr:hypothetical protein [Anaerolineae bacterium]